MNEIWSEMDAQIGNYVRGKFNEIIIVGAVSYIVFIVLGLNYASLLAMLVGLSVFDPLYRRGVATLPTRAGGLFSMGDQFRLCLVDGLVFCDSIPGRQCPGAGVVFRGREPAPGRHYRGDTGIWRDLGLLGRVLCHSLATLVKALINVWPTHDFEQAAAAKNPDASGRGRPQETLIQSEFP